MNKQQIGQVFRERAVQYLMDQDFDINRTARGIDNAVLVLSCEATLGVENGGNHHQRMAALLKRLPYVRKKRKPNQKQREQKRKALGFYKSAAWKRLRYQALAASGGRCACCGAGGESDVILHVDHIKPKSKYPELRLDPNNLQVLCEPCNMGKSNWDETDWRSHELRVVD